MDWHKVPYTPFTWLYAHLNMKFSQAALETHEVSILNTHDYILGSYDTTQAHQHTSFI